MTPPPHVLVSVDMEGIAGIVHQAETHPGRYDYERGRALMTAEANAAVAGVLAAAPDAVVRVADAHGPFRNILVDELDPRARLVRGKPRPLGMLAGLDGDVTAVLFVGYHARAGSGPAVLAHTISGAVLDVRFNGRSLGEIGLNAVMAGHVGAPVVMLSGDDVACAEFTELLPHGVTVPVKRALGQTAAETLHPLEARERIREAAAEAVRRRDRVDPVVLAGGIAVEVDLHGSHACDLAMLVPGVSRTSGGRTVGYPARDVAEAYRVVQLLVQLAKVPSD